MGRHLLTIVLVAVLISTGIVLSIWANPKSPEDFRLYKGETVLNAVDDDTVLFHDNGSTQYYFALPDEWDDHFFNVQFYAPQNCRLLRAELRMVRIDEDTTDLPDIYVFVAASSGQFPDFAPDEFPDSTLETITVDGADILLDPDTTIVEFSNSDNLLFSVGEAFHIGWELVDTATTDTVLAILSDDGIPETDFSSEYWMQNNSWGTIQRDWGLGVNFLIRAYIELIEDTTHVWIEPGITPHEFSLEGAYPNPFNPETNIILELQKPEVVNIQIYDVNGHLIQRLIDQALPAGRNIIPWRPLNLSSGIYLIKAQAGLNSQTIRATLLK